MFLKLLPFSFYTSRMATKPKFSNETLILASYKYVFLLLYVKNLNMYNNQIEYYKSP